MAIVGQMGVAMENRELYEEAKKTSQEQQVLREFLSKLLLLNLDELLQKMTEQAAQLFGAEYARVRLLDEQGRIQTRAVAGDKQIVEAMSVTGEREELVESKQILNSRKPVAIKDMAQEVPAGRPSRGVKAGLHGSLGAPLLGRDQQPLGVIQIMKRAPGDFRQQDLDLIEQFAQGAVIAIGNARLFEEAQRNLHRIQALREIDQAINSTLDLHQVLDLLLEKIEVFLPYPSATTVRLFNQQNGRIEPITCRNLDEAEWKAQPWKVGRGSPNIVFESRRVVTIEDVQGDPRTKDAEFFRRQGLISYLGVPLTVQNEVLGVLSLYAKEKHTFSEQEIDFLSMLAGQASVAIHNSQLYEEAQKRERHLQETNRMLSALHSVAAAVSRSLDLEQVLQSAIGKITEVFNFDATRIHLYDDAKGELYLRASFERDPDRFTSARSFKLGEGIVGKAAESGKAFIFEDVESDLLYRQLSQTNVSRRFGLHFFAVFPIKGKLKSLGTLGCVGTDPRKLSAGEIQLLEALADQIAVAMENSEFYNSVRMKVEELQQKTLELEQANKAKDVFLGVMSHELRTPLNVVIGYSGMLKEGVLGKVNQKQEEALGKVLARTNDQLQMINRILQAAQIGAGAVRVTKEEVSLNEFLEEMRSAYELPINKAVTLHWEYSSELPVIKIDSDKLKRILENIINNAIKFTEKGRITISVQHISKAGTLEFKVTDTGVGIPKAMLPVIFEIFRQVDSSETRRFEGVGLGLYIVKELTELLGGRVAVTSEEGKGSTFTVTIPSEAPTEKTESLAPSPVELVYPNDDFRI